MFLVKFCDAKWRNIAVPGQSIRIGTVLYYREIEDATFRDETEGDGEVVYKGSQPLDADTHNRIFQEEGFRLANGWTIDMGGVPLLSSKSRFNPFIYSCSLVRRKSQIAPIARRFGKNSRYYISDVWKFTNGVADALRLEILKHASDAAMSEGIRKKLNSLELLPLLGKVKYTRESKHRIVDDANLDEFDPYRLRFEPYFQKPPEFSPEQEFRILWVPNLGSIDDGVFNFISTTLRTVDVQLPDNGLSRSPVSIKKILGKRGRRIA